MMSYDQRRPSDVLSSARPNGGRGRMPSNSILGHKRTSSGRMESKENIDGVDSQFSPFTSPELSEGSGRKIRPTFSPVARPISAMQRTGNSVPNLRESDSPHDTKIPRPNTTAPNYESLSARGSPGSPMPASNGNARRIRQPLGLKAAFKLAEAQDARERSGSSSSNGSIDLKRAFEMANAEANRVAVGSPSPAPRSYRRRESTDTRSNQYFGSPVNVDLGQRLQQFDQNHQLSNNGGPLDGIFATKGRTGPNATESTNTLAKKAGNSSSGSTSEYRKGSAPSQDGAGRNSAERTKWDAVGRNSVLPSIEFAPLPPVDMGSEDEDLLVSSPAARPSNLSPEKSYAWDLDADFTAGDLQVSDSPRIKLGRNSIATGGSPAAKSPESRKPNEKLSRIRELEHEAANANIPEDESSVGPKRTNPRLDEIRAREMVARSPRAVAESRLEEIRAKNAEARSRSTSPEEARRLTSQSLRNHPQSPLLGNISTKANGSPQLGERISGTPITVFRNSSNDSLESRPREEAISSYPPQVSAYDDSYDLLRRLALATSPRQSPKNSPESEERKLPSNTNSTRISVTQNSNGPEVHREELMSKGSRARISRDQLAVGFSGLPKRSSNNSYDDKRQSLVNSETDPLDRIEAEMKLFALGDKDSEKASTRAPSPGLSEKSEPIEEETPKQKRIDPLSLPTPRVSGAYVMTPATVKVKRERDDDWVDVESDNSTPANSIPKQQATGYQGSKVEQEAYELSDKVTKSTGKLSAPVRRPKRRPKQHQPLINTASIPTVKDDLRAILRQHHIDDSTLDDFDGLLDDQDIDAKELEKIVDDTVLKIEEDMKAAGLTDQERELQAYDRMSKSLKTGLLGIRSAKQGIERLEDKVIHSDHTDFDAQIDAELQKLSRSTSPSTHKPFRTESVGITWPKLFSRQPRFRLTPLGILTMAIAIWYVIEATFCSRYVNHYECPRGMTCDWSPNEPYFPYAAPFMLDEWATGGKGRALVWRIGDAVGDVRSEVSDWLTGHDFTKDEVMYMNIWERKRHRRRLHRRGIYWKWSEPAQFRHKFQAWRNSWKERQRAIEDGEPIWIDESMSADERL
ncbi:hypothetical protein BKA67DRAFT_574753 [Truncatella angustata]|uniref:Uncharacterized protein n=1 Tax=Truncatella angustata TaxID=152316 RepID=A0A9P8UEE4_9PEZI|nr:uncharacterized protein BKA67DRAFT_574753 [Truncatella angustata]KAH6648422.1 hypothetical protein BKA67DRAFT_574753 [Truncatella angustata]